MKPLLTIICISYNQEKYIRQTIEGFLMQKVNFAYEIIVHDDASTDGTKEIIQEFVKKHPNVFVPMLEKENQYSKTGVLFLKGMYQKARGKYIAVCEGDDFWTDPNKLQTQVDFMEENPDYTVCFHQVNVVYDNHDKKDQIYPDVKNKAWYTTTELLKINYIQTNSVLYRKQNYDNLITNVIPTDWYVHLFHASFGKIKFIEKNMSVYRKHPGGIWWDYDINRDKIWIKHGVDHLAMWIELKKIYAHKHPNYIKVIDGHIRQMIETLVCIDQDYQHNTMMQVATRFPEEVNLYLLFQRGEIKKSQALVSDYEKTIANKQEALKVQAKELNVIKNTYLWKMRSGIVHFLKRLGIHKNT